MFGEIKMFHYYCCNFLKFSLP